MRWIKRIFQQQATILVLRLLVGFIFAYSGISKLADLAGFAEAIDNYRILPRVAVNGFAIVLPWAELIAGLCLISGAFLRGGAMLIAALLIIFTVSVFAGIVRGIDITCGCSTPFATASRIGFGKLIENVVLLIGVLAIFFLGKPGFDLGLSFGKNAFAKKAPPPSLPE
jgi:uncharacterized membrane protein YphA (DoxX/SURF4 family)